MSKKLEFSSNEYVVYPAHGVGKVVSIEEPRLQGGSAIGVFNTKLTVDHDSRALFAGDAVVTAGLARRTLTVAARTDSGAGKMYVQQVQISGAQ